MQETVFISLDRGELESIIIDCVNSCLKYNREAPPQTKKPLIKGIHNLGKFLNISPARAQKLKNEGVFPYFQDGRLIYFDPVKVLESMENYKPGRRAAL